MRKPNRLSLLMSERNTSSNQRDVMRDNIDFKLPDQRHSVASLLPFMRGAIFALAVCLLAWAPARRCGSCSSKGLPWRGRYLKVAQLVVTLIKLRRQQHNQPAFSV